MSHIKSNNSFFRSHSFGADSTSLSCIFVIFDISAGIGISGFINVENLSIISKVFSYFLNSLSLC